MTLLQLHKKWLKTGLLPKYGLCHSLPKKYLKLLKLFYPTYKEIDILCKDNLSVLYWASDLKFHSLNKSMKYTELRQIIVLFIIEMSKSSKT